jgi:hypothetical protein
MLRGILLSTFAFFLCEVCGAADINIGEIEHSAGNAVVWREGKALPATAGTILQLNDIVGTESGGLLRLVLTDGSALLLQGDTELRVARFDTAQQQTLVEMLHGRILVEVAPYTKPGARFVVTTPTASVLMIGTAAIIDTNASNVADVISRKKLDELPLLGGNRSLDSLALLQPATKAGNTIKGVKSKNAAGQPAQPKSLKDIKAGDFASSYLNQFGGIQSTRVGALNHFAAVSGFDAQGVTILTSGNSADAKRDSGVSLSGPIVRDKLWFFSDRIEGRTRSNEVTSGGFLDFDSAGNPCRPPFVSSGQLVSPGSSAPSFNYKIFGTGISTGDALKVSITNMDSCPLYFFIPAGTGFQPKQINKVGSIIGGLVLGGGLPTLESLQNEDSYGAFVRVAPPSLLTAEPAAPVSNAVTEPIRSYCVQLHKLAPHPQSEYKFANEDEQKKMNSYLPLMERTLQLFMTKQLRSPMGHGLDAIVQWALWAKIEKMGEKEFMDEFTKLAHKNYVARNQKWDKDAQKRVADSRQELWKLVQVVLN